MVISGEPVGAASKSDTVDCRHARPLRERFTGSPSATAGQCMQSVIVPAISRESLRAPGSAAGRSAPFVGEPEVGSPPSARVQASGKFFALAGRPWPVRGLTYGPFNLNSANEFLPERPRLIDDFAQIHRLGANALRVYNVPGADVLDEALRHGLRVMVDVPWEKHRCFLEDWSAQEDARRRVRRAAREIGGHPAVFAISVGNEIPHDVVRFHGAAKVRRFLDDLLAAAKDEAPDCLVTYTNYPSTEFLAPERLDFYCANVYLEDVEPLGRYLDRLQHVAGPLPLLLGECGVCALRRSVAGEAERLAGQLGESARHGLAGSFVFSYTDEWHSGGHPIHGWGFGLTDAERQEKPAAEAVRRAWSA